MVLDEGDWFEGWSAERGWRSALKARQCKVSAVAREVVCEVCSRKFHRESNSKCLSERRAMHEQRGAIQCQVSKSGLGAEVVWPSTHADLQGARHQWMNQCTRFVALF